MPRRVMLVDDERHVLRALERALRAAVLDEKPRIELFSDPEAALSRARATAFDVFVSDYRMPRLNGVEFLRLVRDLQPDAVRIMLSASRDFDAVQRAINEAQILRYLCKPWETTELKELLHAAFEHRDQLLEERKLADLTRLLRGELSPAELERRRLEEAEPGITKVNWGPDGSVLLEEE